MRKINQNDPVMPKMLKSIDKQTNQKTSYWDCILYVQEDREIH